MKTITELRQEIVDRSLQAFHEGLFSGTSGNMSCYLREEDLMQIAAHISHSPGILKNPE